MPVNLVKDDMTDYEDINRKRARTLIRVKLEDALERIEDELYDDPILLLVPEEDAEWLDTRFSEVLLELSIELKSD